MCGRQSYVFGSFMNMSIVATACSFTSSPLSTGLTCNTFHFNTVTQECSYEKEGSCLAVVAPGALLPSFPWGFEGGVRGKDKWRNNSWRNGTLFPANTFYLLLKDFTLVQVQPKDEMSVSCERRKQVSEKVLSRV